MATGVKFVTVADLRDTLRAMAAVTLVLRPKFPDHEFRFDAATGVATARWGDFAGNRCHFLFHSAGSVILGFDHESPMSPHASCTGPDDFRAWPGVYESLPTELGDAIRTNPFEPDWDFREVTLCLWNMTTGPVWSIGDIEYPERDHGDPDGQGYILGRIGNYVRDFAGEFEEVYSWELNEGAVAELLSGDEITRDCLSRLNSQCDVTASVPALVAIGYRVT